MGRGPAWVLVSPVCHRRRIEIPVEKACDFWSEEVSSLPETKQSIGKTAEFAEDNMQIQLRGGRRW